MSSEPRIARAALHMWEEPPISGEGGSGTVFFVGCTLRCVYCQNAAISQPEASHIPGRSVSVDRLAEIFCELQDKGAHNINLVTATHYAPHVISAVQIARANGLAIPIVYNTSGYERTEMIEALADTVDIWLTDFKYGESVLSGRHSHAHTYPEAAEASLIKMHELVTRSGGRKLSDDGLMLQGLIVRHLLLPDGLSNAQRVLDTIYKVCGSYDADVSIMNQYTPTEMAKEYGPPLDQTVSEDDYEAILVYADTLGFEHIWWQEGGTVDESFIPAWDNSGV